MRNHVSPVPILIIKKINSMQQKSVFISVFHVGKETIEKGSNSRLLS